MTKRLMPMIEDSRESEQLRGLLEAGRDARVSGYDFDRGLRQHLSQIEAGAPMPQWAEGLQAGGAAAARSGIGALLAWVGAPVVTASIVAAYLFASGASEAPAVPQTTPAAPVLPAQPLLEPAPTAESPAAVAAAAPSAPEAAAQPESPPAAAAAAEHERVRSEVRARGDQRRSHAAAQRPDRLPASNGSGLAPALTPKTATAAPAALAPTIEAARAAEASAAAPAAAARTAEPIPAADEAPAQAEPARPEPARIDDSRLEREMGMLAMAQRVLLNDPERAWKLARQGEAEFPGSMFTEERQQLLLLSLVKLGRLDEAKQLARPYLARYPKGPFSDRVRRSLASGRVER